MRLPLAVLAFALIVVATAWWWIGAPVRLPASYAAGGKYECLSYAPFRGAQSPLAPGTRVERAQIEQDLARLAAVTKCVRTYSITHGLDQIPAVAEQFGLKVIQGLWLSNDRAKNKAEMDGVIALAKRYPNVISAIVVGNEVLLRGEGIMDGYHNNPEATAEVKDDEGWFHTGDIGEIDSNGFLKITDRKKDLFKTSNGKYVAPSQLEASFKALCPYVSQILVHGNNRNFVSALVTLDAEAIKPWAAANGMDGKSYEEIVTSAQAHDMVQGYIEQLNGGLNRWEQVKKFSILGSDFTVDGGELTPSLKMKRKVVQDKFAKDLDAFYA